MLCRLEMNLLRMCMDVRGRVRSPSGSSVRVSAPDTTRENGSWDFMVCADMMRISRYVYPEMNPQLPERKAWLDMDGWT